MKARKAICRFSASLLIALVGCAGVGVLAGSSARADFDISEFGVSNSIGNEFSREAGAHADFTTVLDFSGQEQVRDLRVDLPAGMLGDPTVASHCTSAQLVENIGRNSNCPVDSVVGSVMVRGKDGPVGDPGSRVPLYNMVAPVDAPALFAMNYSSVIVLFKPTVRPSDYGITTTVNDTTIAKELRGATVKFWAVPSDPIHDTERLGDSTPASVFLPRRPMMTNPTSCGEVRTPFRAAVNSWQTPAFVHREVTTDLDGTPFRWDGCFRVPFEPSMRVTPGTHRAASTSGLEFDVKVPQSDDPYGIASSHLRRIVTTFPQGMTVSPSAVAGLGACSEAQVGLGNNDPPTCPDSSKLGNVTIQTPVLEERLRGEVVLAKQNENPLHSTYAIYQIVKGPGFYLKLPGELNLNKQTGQMKVVVDNLPQLPFEDAEFDFRGGPTAPFTTPDTCGTYQTRSELTSWSGKTVVVDAPMLIDENCSGKGGFNPKLQAGVANPVAGARSPLTIRIKREDGEQNLSRFDVTLPKGEVANLKGLAVCPDSLAPSGNCPKGSQVGISTTAIGTGVFPLFVPQPGKDPTALYLGGPYKGSPYSLIALVPAQSGPFDFGDIVVRTAINLNPVTAQVIAESDPLPQILEGVPIQYRDVRIEVQKPDFSVNPTSCEQRFVTTSIHSIQGAVAHPSVPTKVGDCAALNFGPKLALKVQGGTNRGDFQALTATLTTGKKEANIASAQVTLPHSEFLEQSHIRTICTRVQFAAKKCPAASVYGTARAITPLLDDPLEGPVYLRASNHSLPDMVADLQGQFDIELAGRIDSVNESIRNTFELVPDAPVSKFVLKLQGGQKSLLVNSRNLCKSVSRADVKLVGQNGKRHTERPVVENSCGGKAKKKARGKKGRAGRRGKA